MKREINRIMHPGRDIQMKGYQILFFVVFLFITKLGLGQTTLQTVDFEIDGSGYSVSPSESNDNDDAPDYWTRTNGTTPAIYSSNTFTTSNGSYFFAAEDLDYDAGDTAHTVTCGAVSVSGYSSLQIKLLIGGRSGTSTIEGEEFLKIQYNMDAGGWVTRSQFIGDSRTNYYEDADANGTIDGSAIDETMSEFTYSIPVTGSSLQLRIYFFCGGSEELAVDNIRLLGTLSNAAPTVTNTTASSISTTSATLGGNVTADGGATVTERGVVYSTSDATPTIAEGASKDVNGSGTGVFSKSIGSLSSGTTYYYNAYAINSEGTSYGTANSFTTMGAPTVTTQAVSSIATITATGNGNITDLGVPNPSQHGVCWSTSTSPTIGGSKTEDGSVSSTGAFTSSITGLSAGTTYYVRAYATNSVGTSYGAQVSFTTNAAPAISINDATLAFTERPDELQINADPTQIDAAATLNDTDGDTDWNGGKLEVQITSNPEAADEISIPDNEVGTINTSGTDIRNGSTIIGTLSASEGTVTNATKLTITFNANASNALVQDVLRAIHYRSTSDEPDTSNRTITITATDNGAASVSDTRTISVTTADDAPTFSATGLNPTFTEDGSAAVVFSSTSASTIESVQKLTGFRISVTNVNDGASEIINVDGVAIALTNGSGTTTTNSLSYTVSVDHELTASITFTGGELTPSAFETVIDEISYQNDSNTPNTTDRRVGIHDLTDSGLNTGINLNQNEFTAVQTTVTVVAVNDAPSISINSSTLAYTEDNAATQIDPIATLSDPEGDTEWNAGILEVQITANNESADEISIPDNVVGSINTSGTNILNDVTVIGTLSASEGTVTSGTKLTITFNSSATNALVQQVLRAIHYRNTSDNPGTSNRTVTTTAKDKNAATALDTRTISVTASDDTPTVPTNNALSLNEGASATISSVSHLSASDADDDDAILVFTLTTNTSNGTLKKSGSIVNQYGTFTQADLTAGNMTYVHDGTNTESDSFIFKVSDDNSNELTNQTFSITVNAIDDDTPTIAVNNGLTLNEGATKGITLAMLEANDTDTDNATLIFTVTSAPSNGQLENTDNSGVAISSFAQQHLIDGKIQYVHDGSNTISDSFTFKVADGFPNQLTGQTFNITVNAVDDDAPTIAVNNGLTLNEGATKGITLAMLEANDTDTDNATLIFTVTSAPSNGRLENTDNPGNVISSFAQQHLIDGKIVYVHDGSNTTSDSFVFKVTDGLPNELTGQIFSITVAAVDDDTPSIAVNNGLTLDEGATKGITLSKLEANDTDTDNASLTYTITSAPSNGQLENTDNSGVAISSFTQQHLIDDKIQYVHDGSNTTSDSFTFKVADGMPNELTGQIFSITVAAVDDDTPTIAVNNGLTLDEGATKGITLAMLEANDTDTDNASLIYTITSALSNGQLENTDNSGVGISSFTQQYLIDGKIQYVHDGSNTTSDSFTFKVADGTPNELRGQTFNITVTAVDDDTPTIAVNNGLTIDEGATKGITLAMLEANDTDSDNASLTYTITSALSNGQLENTDNSGVGISSFTQQHLIEGKIQYVHDGSNTTSDSFTFKVADGMPNELRGQIFNITVNGINDENPVITADQAFSINENLAINTSVGTVLATDADAGTTFSSWTIISGNGDAIFAINSTSGKITVADNSNLDFETTTSYTLSVTVSDGANTSIAENITINIVDINDNKPIIIPSQDFTINENLHNENIFGSVSAMDKDAGTTLFNWTIIAGNTNNAFVINSENGQISINNSSVLDREKLELFNLEITVSDGELISEPETVTVYLNDLNDNRPVIVSDQSFILDENPVENKVLGMVSALDADVTATTFQNWTITNFVDFNGNGNNAIAINPATGKITVNDPLDFDCETTSSFSIMVKASDGTDFGAEEKVVININDLNDVAPAIIPAQVYHVEENVGQGTLVATIEVTDLDVTPTESFYFSWVEGNTNSAFVLNPNNGEIRINNPGAINYEVSSKFELVFVASDGTNIGNAETITILIDDINEFPPIITPDIFSVDENAAINTVVGEVVAIDGDKGTTFSSWTITGGNTDAIFTIDATSGAITITDNTNLDFETTESYTLSVTVSDGTNTSTAENVIININNVNDNTPMVTANQSFLIDEDVVNNTSVGTILATDMDSETTFSNWAITGGNEKAIFGVDATSGEITITDNTNLDFETTTSYTLSVTVSDGVKTSSVETVSVNINDINDELPVVTASQSFTVNETALNDASVGTVLANDADAGTTFSSWTITSGNEDAIFGVDATSGAITITDNTNLDFETTESYTLSVTVSDGTNTSTAENVIININNVNDNTPMVTANQSFLIDEDVANNTSVGTILATDMDSETTFSNWAITGGNEKAIFGVDAASGELTIDDNANLDFETTTSYTLSVTVSDGENTCSAQSVKITVKDVNERPVANAGENQTVADNSKVTLNASDSVDPEGDELGFKWSAPEGIELSDVLDPMPTFMAPDVSVLTDYVFTLVVDDGDLYSEEVSVTISIDNVTGIEEIDSEKVNVSLYPNPSKGTFYLELNKRPVNPATLSIISLSGQAAYGQKLYEKKTFLNLSLKSGMYILKIELDDKIMMKKIIIHQD